MSRTLNPPRTLPLLCALGALLAISSQPHVSAGPDPDTGPVGLAELIARALKNDPGLRAARGEISIAEARKRVARQWPDPQLRFRTNWGFNELPAPYRETRRESGSETVTRERVDENGQVQTSRATERFSETTERKITPGRDRTVIEEQTRERRSENTNINPNPDLFLPGGTTNDDRTSVRNSRETRIHEVDPFASEQDLEVMLRIYVPHPGVRRALLAKAEHRIALAQTRLLSLEHAVVLEVRELYEELQYLKTRTELAARSNDAAETFRKAQDKLIEDGDILLDDIDFVPVDDLAVEAAKLSFESKRAELAARVGIHPPERIRVTDRLVSPGVNLEHTHLEYLIRMAFARRGELAEIRGMGQIAEADLRAVKAKHIPWFDYVQVGAGRGEQGGTKTETNWGVSFAMGLPIFTWLGHEAELHEAEIASYYSQMDASKEIVTAEVVAAYQNVKKAAAFRTRARSYAVNLAKSNEEFLERLEGMEPHKFEKTRHRINRSTSTIDERRLDAERTYNRALLQLEKALGTTLDKVLSNSANTPEAMEAAAAGKPPIPSIPSNPQPLAVAAESAAPGLSHATTEDRADEKPKGGRLFGRFQFGKTRRGSGFSNGRKHK